MPGYRNPPENTRFKKGQSGNPKGRPKRQSNDIGAALLKALKTVVTVRENGRPERMTARKAIVRERFHAAAKGDLRAIDDVQLLRNIPGDYQEEIYIWAGHWGVPPMPPEEPPDER